MNQRRSAVQGRAATAARASGRERVLGDEIREVGRGWVVRNLYAKVGGPAPREQGGTWGAREASPPAPPRPRWRDRTELLHPDSHRGGQTWVHVAEGLWIQWWKGGQSLSGYLFPAGMCVVRGGAGAAWHVKGRALPQQQSLTTLRWCGRRGSLFPRGLGVSQAGSWPFSPQRPHSPPGSCNG